MNKYKIGDWVYHEYELYQVCEMDGDDVTSLTTGVIRSSSSSFNEFIYPIDLSIKVISESVEYYDKQLRGIKKHNLNWPDLKREFSRRWHEIIKQKNNKEVTRKLWDDMSEFTSKILHKCENLDSLSVDGVRVFR